MPTKRFDRLPNQSLADQARELIRSAVFEGRIKPEERFTIERIAEELGVSRTPVREALKALEADGVLRLLPRRGAVVRRFEKAEIYDRYSVRAVLEGYAGELACRARGAELARDLRANCETLAREASAADPNDLNAVRRLVELNRAFHNQILQASGSPTVVRTLGPLVMPLGYQLYHWRTRDRQDASLTFHWQIAEAFEANDPQRVRQLLEGHIVAARDFLMSIQQDPD